MVTVVSGKNKRIPTQMRLGYYHVGKCTKSVHLIK
jgi:hypothetical protein